VKPLVNDSIKYVYQQNKERAIEKLNELQKNGMKLGY
jgi:hypothetical protein